MKTKKIVKKLENLISTKQQQKSNEKQMKLVIKFISLLENKEKKYGEKIIIKKNESEIKKYTRKFNLTKLYLTKARAYKLELES